MDGQEGRDGGTPQTTLPAPLPGQGTWIGDELQRAQQRVESLTREIMHMQQALKAQQEESARLLETVQIL